MCFFSRMKTPKRATAVLGRGGKSTQTGQGLGQTPRAETVVLFMFIPVRIVSKSVSFLLILSFHHFVDDFADDFNDFTCWGGVWKRREEISVASSNWSPAIARPSLNETRNPETSVTGKRAEEMK